MPRCPRSPADRSSARLLLPPRERPDRLAPACSGAVAGRAARHGAFRTLEDSFWTWLLVAHSGPCPRLSPLPPAAGPVVFGRRPPDTGLADVLPGVEAGRLTPGREQNGSNLLRLRVGVTRALRKTRGHDVHALSARLSRHARLQRRAFLQHADGAPQRAVHDVSLFGIEVVGRV